MATEIKDGIISYLAPDVFHSQHRKVLFILKEAVRRDPSKEDDELRLLKYLYKGADSKSPTWNNTVIWSYLLRHYGDDEADVSWERASKTIRNKAAELRKIAVININKKGGAASTDDKKLYASFCRDAETQKKIRSQIEEDIRPDISLCGGRVVRDGLQVLYPDLKWRNVTLHKWIRGSYAQFGKCIIIQYYHPQYIGFKRVDLYVALLELLAQVIES